MLPVTAPWDRRAAAASVAYAGARRRGELNRSLEAHLADSVFADADISTLQPNVADVAGFASYLERYRAGLGAVRAAAEAL